MENNENLLVMIPGPTPVVDSIRAEMAKPIQAFGDPRFVSDYKKLIDDLGTLFNCSGQTFPLAGSGTAAMEMAISNVTKRGDNVLIVSNGYFGDRFIEIAERKGLNADVLSAEWGSFVTPEEIEAKLNEKTYAAITVTHVDTSTAVVAPIKAIGDILKNHPETIYIVDGVAAAAAEYVNVDEMNIDILFTGSQKAFGVCPGMFVLWAGNAAIQRRKELGTIPEYYLDFEKWLPIMDNPAKYFATPAVNLVWAMAESVALIKKEGGLKVRAERHSKNAKAFAKALESIGFKILAHDGCRASTLSVCIYPEGVSDDKFRKALMDNGIICAGSLGEYAGKSFRIGHMGNVGKNEMIIALSAIERSLYTCGASVEIGKAVATYVSEMMN